MPSINPYLVFDGNCEEAFEFYRSVFGGEFSDVSRFSEAPPDAQGSTMEADKIMYMSLRLADDQELMGSDRPSNMGTGTFGDSVSANVRLDSNEAGQRVFDGLAAGGETQMPYEPQFWGSHFGMCTDKYGINWLINYTPET